MKDNDLYIETADLPNFARNTAALTEAAGEISGRAEARAVSRVLTRLKSRLTAGEGGAPNSPAREWFSDNWYVAEREGKSAAFEFSGAGKLPKSASTGRSRVYEAASSLVRSGLGEVTEDRMRVFLEEYQNVSVLTERELGLFIPALKAALTEYLDGIYPEGDWDDEREEELAGRLAAIFTSLRLLGSIDVTELLSYVNRVERTLSEDPAGVYHQMDEETRRNYRRELSHAARRAGISEYEAARTVLEMSRTGEGVHVGEFIFTRPLGGERREGGGGAYIAAVILSTLFLTLLAGILFDSLWLSLLALLPISEIVKNAADFAALKIVRPRPLPRMSLEGGIPGSAKAVCVISALLTDPGDGERYGRILEEFKLLNRDAGENLFFGILADLRESQTQRRREDAGILEGAERAITKLNGKYGGGFYLFYRDRELSKTDNVYMGRERKRGAIEELVRLLSGERSALRALAGDVKAIDGAAFIVTLDADTRLTAGSIRELVGAALHPLNVPVMEEGLGRVTRGYGILQPRVSVELSAAGKSDFTRVFAGEGGVDPYNSAVSDLYEDVFGAGTFMGKGLINVRAYRELLEGVFPDNAILSHDILEGEYLRCGYLSDTQFTDGWPYKVTAYFARQERWTRGDWQNLRWCMRRVPRRDGSLVRNPLSSVSRFKVADNLRRSALPIFTFLSIFLGLVTGARAMTAAAIIAVVSTLSGLLLTSAELIVRHDGSTRARYQSAIVSGVAAVSMRVVIRLMLLPAEAWIQFTAIVTALYRMTVSKKRLLAWVTASDAERRHGNTLGVNYKKLAACPAAGAALILLAANPAAGAVGLVWIFTPAYAWALSREIRRERAISSIDRSFLISCAGDIWRYFEDNLTPEDNFLPPDNVQEEPSLGPAHRTSPTNIGLALLSAVAASELGLIPESRARELTLNTLSSVERMEKWRGHLYNWYDTRSLAPLEPRYVSTVDSGNLLGCLVALKSWYLRCGEGAAAERVENLIDDMDFSPLFDNSRKLFYIGWDIPKGEATKGWYDLLASEARATSYVTIALGKAPRKHWRRLGRALVSQDNYSGMASWTGTMFEYLMPNLLLPCERDSLLYESSRFCLYAQRRAVHGIPWGISESAYYAFDPGLSYRYKAHGVQRLALRRKMGIETVVSPYSTFLALPLEPKSAIKNLRRMAQLGLTGKYGFYEAADFTPSRCVDAKYEVVRTYMAHHLGMSIVATANALLDDLFPKLFMSDRRMSAYRELLEERVPTGGIVLRQPPRDVPEKPRRQDGGVYSQRIEGVDAIEPMCLPLSNGSYTVLLTESGKSRSTWRGLDMTRFDPEALGGPGMAFYLKTPSGLMPITAAPDYDPGTSYGAEFTHCAGKLRASRGALRAELTVFVPPSGAGEVRVIDVTAPQDTAEAEVICVFEPVLERREDFAAHPAFSKLSLEAERRSGEVIIRRRPREGRREAYFAAAASSDLVVTTSRRRGDGLEAGEFLTSDPEFRVVLRARLVMNSGRGSVTFAFAPGETSEEAAGEAAMMLRSPRTQAISRIGAAALMLGMRERDVRSALSAVTGIVFGVEPSEGRRELLAAGKFERRDLWRFGISGDIPVVAARVEGQGELEEMRALIREHAFLAENGVLSDLAIIITDGGDYRSAQRGAIMDLLHRLGREGSLGARGGVHIVDGTDESSRAVEALCRVYRKLDAIPAAPAHRERAPIHEPVYLRGSDEPSFRMEEGIFRLALRDSLPERAWSHVLTGEDFGFLATECGTGYMWYKNSRQMKINRWLNDPLTTAGTERLELITPTGRHSLFADGSGEPTLVEYGFGYAKWERDFGKLRTKVTAFVPPEGRGRVLEVELSGDTSGAEVEYFTELVLGEWNEPRREIVTGRDNGAFTARNPAGEYAGTVFTLVSSEEPVEFTCDADKYLLGELDGSLGAGVRPCFALRFPASGRLVLAEGCAPRGELETLLRDAPGALERTIEHWRRVCGAVSVATPSPDIDRYVNGWAVYQTVASRIMARTALYQNGGAVGFRDQLQDVCAVSSFLPELAANQIKMAAAHQYLEGDVQHWWHPGPEGDAGVRTRCSDDYLWLPYALTDYVTKTGDWGICRLRAPYLVSRPLGETERDRYERPDVYPDKETILSHAMRSCELFISRGAGEHGLALMLRGDWNDGMDAVGREGRGESVWLTMFGTMVLRDFAAICRREGEAAAAERFESHAAALRSAAERANQGGWYLRGYYDDGTPLGAPGDGECEIDSISQSFAVLSGCDPERARGAVNAAYERLFDREHHLVRLFDPPFDRGPGYPGYIKAYAPGFRENGGQYTHGAVWLAIALLRAGERERGAELLAALSPWGRESSRYGAEPYVLSADVYSAPGHEGRGGWSWYTGSAGWYFRAVTEELLGLRIRDGVLYVEPNIPDSWGGCFAEVEGRDGPLKIAIYPEGVLVNGEQYNEAGYPLKIHNNFVSMREKM